MNGLTQEIEKIITEKTFSLEAADAIRALKEKAINLENSLQEEKELVKKLRARIEAKENEVKSLTDQVNEQAKRIIEDRQTINSMQAAEREGKEAKAELRGFTNAMQMVFRPSVVRESIQKRVPVAVEGNRGSNGMCATSGYVVESNESSYIEKTSE